MYGPYVRTYMSGWVLATGLLPKKKEKGYFVFYFVFRFLLYYLFVLFFPNKFLQVTI